MVELANLGLFIAASDVEEDTEVVFVNEGKMVSPEETGFDEPVFQITVRLPNGQAREWSMNLTSQRIVARKYGTTTGGWVGKSVKLTKKKMVVKGKDKEVIFVKGE